MSCIAQLLLRRGNAVSGSDVKDSALLRQLRTLGATVSIGHAAAAVQGVDEVIYSSAIKEDNPEMQEARRLGLPLLKRAEALAQLMKDKCVITVAGSHGKTTTTSLASLLLLNAGLAPSVAIGGILRNIATNACLGNGDYFVAEADESDGSFLYYEPQYSIVTNIDVEHMDYFKDFSSELEAFKKFISLTRHNGCVFWCGDDPHLCSLMQGYSGRHISFGLTEACQVFPRNIAIEGLQSSFDCFAHDAFVGHFDLALGGRHNVSNALSVIALGLSLGIDIDCIKKTLAQFKGAARRLDITYQDAYCVIDDYAHHPTEIRATLDAVRKLNKRTIAIFQPHRYTRTKALLEDFARSFSMADYVIVTDIYPASEMPLEGITGQLVCDRIKAYDQGKKAVFLPRHDIVSHVKGLLQPGDVVITLGAGDIIKINHELVESLKH